MQTKLTIAALIIVGVLIFGVFVFQGGVNGGKINTVASDVEVATVEDGVQYIDITAKGGYSPRVIQAKAGVPTKIRVTTKNTFDCSSALVIPDLQFQTYLKPTDTVEIVVPVDKAQGIVQGMCSMAMYHFEIRFE